MVVSRSMARGQRLRRKMSRRLTGSRITSTHVNKSTSYLKYLNEGSITFKVKIKKGFLTQRRQLRLTPHAISIISELSKYSPRKRAQRVAETAKNTWGYEQLISTRLIDDA